MLACPTDLLIDVFCFNLGLIIMVDHDQRNIHSGILNQMKGDLEPRSFRPFELIPCVVIASVKQGDRNSTIFWCQCIG